MVSVTSRSAASMLPVQLRRAAPVLLSLAGFAVAVVVVTWPLATRFGDSTYGGPGDGWALIWQTRFRFEHGISYFDPTFSTDIGWPVGASIASALLLSNAAIELPTMLLLLIGVGDVAAYNLIVVAAALTSSLAMYALLRRIECRPGVAFWGGLAYLLAPWHLEKLGIHPTLASMASLPLLLLGIVEWARRPSLRSGALLAGACALAVYTHSYYGIMAGLVLVAALPLVLIAAHRRHILRIVATRTAWIVPVLVFVPLPLAFALALQSSDVSPLLDRPGYLVELAARPHLWLIPSSDNPVFGSLSGSYIEDRGLRQNEGELALYLGLLTLVLAGVGVFGALRGRVPRFAASLAAGTALVGIVFSAPDPTRFPLLGTVRMPIAYLNDLVDFVSTPARFFALTLTGAIVLAALGLEFLAKRVGVRWAWVVVAAACLISAIELPFHRDGRVVDAGPTPLVQAIEALSPGEPVAQYPSMHSFYKPIADQLFYQVDHGRPLMNGAPATSEEDAVRIGLEDHEDPTTPAKLALLGFRWATYDVSQAAEKALLIGTPFEDASAYEPPRGFRIVRRLPDATWLMRVEARPASAFVSIGTGFTRTGRWVTQTDATLLACATSSGRYTLRFKAGAFAQNRFFRIGNSPIVYLKTPGERSVRTTVRLRPGWQFLRIDLIGAGPTRPSDVIPGEPDTRPLAVSIGPIDASGPMGSPEHCRRAPPLGEVPTVG